MLLSGTRAWSIHAGKLGLPAVAPTSRFHGRGEAGREQYNETH